MRKPSAKKYFTRTINGSALQVVNARQEISRGSKEYGVNWKFEEVSREEFLNEIKNDDKMLCIQTKSNKFVEIRKDNIDKYNI